MLPANARLTGREAFRSATRSGAKTSSGGLVVHLAPRPTAEFPQPRVGFVVGRRVGPAVRRNRVRRQLRHLMAPRLHRLPPRSDLVVRALPRTGQMTGRDLEQALDACLRRLLTPTATQESGKQRNRRRPRTRRTA